MLPWGYRGLPEDGDYLTTAEALELMENSVAKADYTPQQRENMLRAVLDDLQQGEVQQQFNRLAEDRAEYLIDAHDRAWKAAGKGNRFQMVRPVLPMDIMGIYLLAPFKS
jgi:hypothetical protein